MNIKIWDNYHKGWLFPLVIYFGGKGIIHRVEALENESDTPMKKGWWTFEGEDLQHIAIIGTIEFNKHLIV